jgi:hypothetical protein
MKATPERLEPKQIPAPGRKLAAEAIGIDCHIDSLQRVLVMGEDLGKRWNVGHVGFHGCAKAGCTLHFSRPWVPVYFSGAEAARRTLVLRDAMQSVLDGHKNQVELAPPAADIRRIVKATRSPCF